MSKKGAKIPKHVKIGAVSYTVKQVEDLKRDFDDGHGMRWLYGYVSNQHVFIEVEKRQSRVSQRVALLHEIMHAILHKSGHYDVDETVEERLVQCLSFGVFELIKDNPDLKAWLFDS